MGVKNIKFTDYVKLNEMKHYLLSHLDNMGLREQVRTMNDTDLEKIMSLSSFTFSDGNRAPGTTCCGKEERCDTPPCDSGGVCRKG